MGGNGDYEATKANFDQNIEQELNGNTKMSGGVADERLEQDSDGDEPNVKSDTDNIDVNTTDIDGVESEVKQAVETKVGVETDGVEAKTKASLDMDALGLSGKVANGVCQVYNMISSIGRMVKAYEVIQVIAVAYKVIQAYERIKAGEGGFDVLADVISNYLVSSKTMNLSDVSSSYVSGSGENSKFNMGVSTVTGSIISSTPITSLFGGRALTQDDPIVSSYLVTGTWYENLFRIIGTGEASAIGYRACIGTQLAAAVIDVVGDIASIVTYGLSSVLKDVSVSAVFSSAVAIVVSFAVPLITNALTRNFTDLLSGPMASGGLFWGTSFVMGRMGQMNGCRPATQASWTTYVAKRNDYIAERARYERANKSPFDINSQYTFLGSLVANFRTMTIKTDSILGKAGNILSVANKSFLALTPASHAADAEDVMVSEGDCALNEINGTSSEERMYCNAFEVPWFVPDYDTMDVSPEDVMWYWETHQNHLTITAGTGSFVTPYDPVSNPNPAIREGTDLALHIEEYNNRSSELNLPDSAIENKYAMATTTNDVGDATLGVIPVVGSLIDIFNNTEKAAHVDQILGSQYTNEQDASIRYENDMAERYTQDQDMGVAFGVYNDNQVTAYMNDYYEKHPLDQSTEGIIARYSGLSKDEVVANLQVINTYSFVAQYEPKGLGPVVVEDVDNRVYIENNSIDNDYYLAALHPNNQYYYRKDQYITA